MPDLEARTPLDGLARSGCFGAIGPTPGVIIEEQTNLALASVIARRGASGGLVRAVAAIYGIELPKGPRVVTNGQVAFAGVGVDQWLANAEGAAGSDFVSQLRARLAGLASISDQSDARIILRVSGERVRDVLAKGIPIDLHSRVFNTGDVAATLVSHIGVQIQQLDDRPTFQLMAFRSFAGSLWSWLTAAAAEFGYEVKISDRRMIGM